MRGFRHAREAYPGRDGKRRTRFLVVRNTYPQLETSTIKDFNDTFVDKFPKDYFGKWRGQTPWTFTFDFDDVLSEWIFMAFPDETAISQAKSLQLTGVIFHETRFLDRAVVGNLIERTGRFPPKETILRNFPDDVDPRGVEPQWYGAIGDTNMPPNQHWLTTMAGLEPIPAHIPIDERPKWEKPDDWEIYLQPPGLREKKDAGGKTVGYEANPRAENLTWLPGGSKYYLSKIKEGRSYLDSQVLNKPAIDRAGQPVHPDYNDQVHYIGEEIPVDVNRPLIGGIDLGNCFALELAQSAAGVWSFVDELFLKGISTEAAAIQLRELLATRYPEHWNVPANEQSPHPGILLYCGDDGTFSNSHHKELFSHIQIMRKEGLMVHIAPGGNRMTTRCAAMDTALRRFPMGTPGVRISSRCPMLRTGLQSGFIWKQAKTADGTATLRGVVDKNDWSHPTEAAHYALLGGGEGIEALGLGRATKTNTLSNTNVFDRGRRGERQRSVFHRGGRR